MEASRLRCILLLVTLAPAGTLAQEAPEAASKAGFVPGQGFIVGSADESWKLRVGLQAGYQLEPVFREGDSQDHSAFFVIRPILAGNLFKPWIKFWTSLELANNPPFLLDSYVDIAPWKTFGVRVGQQYTPFSRHESYGPHQILFPEFAPVANYFWSGRDKGITAFGTWDGKLDTYAGAYGGSPLRQFTIISGNYLLEGRVTVSPLGAAGADSEYPYITADGSEAPFRISFTLQGYYGKIQQAIENFNPTTFSFTEMPSGMTSRNGTGGVDVFVQGRRFVAFAEAYFRRTDPEGGSSEFTALGAWGQAGILLIEQTLDFGIRLSWIDPSRDLDNDRFIAGEAQFAYYVHAPNVVLKLRYGVGDQDTPGMAALGPVSLPIPPGTTHIVTLQLNIAF